MVAWRRGRAQAGSRGFTLLELIIVIIIIALLLKVAIDKMLGYMVDAERVAVQGVVGGLRSAMTIEVAYRIMKDQTASLADLIGTNPMRLAAEVPSNYMGEIAGGAGAPGHWHYDSAAHVLVYRVRNAGNFVSEDGGDSARFRIEPVYDDRNGNGVYDREVDTLRGLRLAPLARYRWQKD
jgi:MSHA pilin protein MshA